MVARLKTWSGTGETLTTADINAEFNNLVNAISTDTASHIDLTDVYAWTGAHSFSAAVTHTNTITVGVNDTGHDVKFFGASAGAYMEWDESADQLRIMGASADATTSTGKLLLATSLTDVNANDVLGKIDFQAPHEAGGTDAITVAASIQAIAQGTFAAGLNATDLIFYTGHSEAATEKLRITSQGEIGIGGANYGTDGQVLTSAGAGAAPAWESPTVGDITGVTAGVGLSGGGTTGALTLTLDLSELSTVTPADGDFFSTLDSDGANEQKTTTTALATLFAGTGLTASSSVIGVDASQTQITSVGTIGTGTWQGTKVASAYLDDDTAHLSGTQTFSGAKTFTGVTTHGGNVVSDTDSTDDLGTTGVRWKDLYIDSITCTDQITATGFTGTLDGILGSGTPAAATVTTFTSTGIDDNATGEILQITDAGATVAGNFSATDLDGIIGSNTAAAGSFTTLTAGGDVTVANGYGLVVGGTAQQTISDGGGATDVVPEVQILGTATADMTALIGGWSTTATRLAAPTLALLKSGNATIASHTVVTDDEILGSIIAYGDDGTDYESSAAAIEFAVDGTPGTGDMPGRIAFYTTVDAGEVLAERMRIDSTGDVGIGITPTTNLEVATNIRVTGGEGVVSSFQMWADDGDDNADKWHFTGSAGGNLTVANQGASSNYTFVQTGWLGIGEAVNTNMTVGLTINQGANDDGIFAFKSSDVGHAMTGIEEADTYGSFRKVTPTGGGLRIRGYTDGDGAASEAIMLQGFLGEAADTTDTSSSSGVVTVNGSVTDAGTSVTVVADAGNVFTVENNGTARVLVKGNGDMHVTNTTLTALDNENDVGLVRAMQRESSNGLGMAMTKWDDEMTTNSDDLKRVGALSSQGDFRVVQRYQDVLGGAIWQTHTRQMELEERVVSMELALLEATDTIKRLESN